MSSTTQKRVVICGQRYKIIAPRRNKLVAKGLDLNLRIAPDLTMVLGIDVAIEEVAGAIELVQTIEADGRRQKRYVVYAECTACNARSRSFSVRGRFLDTWAGAHRCGRDRALAPDYRAIATRKVKAGTPPRIKGGTNARSK